MRTAKANAEVGTDVYSVDPTVRALVRATADLLGKEDAVYMPTHCMSSRVRIRLHIEPVTPCCSIRMRMTVPE
jgi:threonine aldolase